MFFKPNAILNHVSAHAIHYQKAKMQTVSGRGFHSLSFRLSGSIRILSGTTEWFSDRGCVTFIPKGLPYRTEVLEDGEMLVIHFDTTTDYEGLYPAVIHPDESQSLQETFARVAQWSRTGNDYRCLAGCYEILAQLEQWVSVPKKEVLPPRMRQAKRMIDENFNETLTVSALARQAGISEAYFRREFRQCFGLSPVDYIRKVRIEHAKLLLSMGYYSVSDVAVNCGFNSISYFSYEFRRATGATPMEYIKIGDF